MDEKKNNSTKTAANASKSENKAAKKPSGAGSRLRAIELLYQPVFDTHLNMAIDFEAQMRINDRLTGVMLPEYFMPVAEKSNQICELNKWSVEEACEAILRCEKREADIDCIILPISVKYLSKPYFMKQVTKIVEKYSVNPDKFCFNINESILEDEKEQVFKSIKEAREYGFKVSIDDFGVEFTSMSNLMHYEVDYLSLNAKLIEGIEEDEKVQNRLQGIVEFAKKVEMSVRVDGVDTQEKADMLKKFGVVQMKGSLYGKPMKENQIKI